MSIRDYKTRNNVLVSVRLDESGNLSPSLSPSSCQRGNKLRLWSEEKAKETSYNFLAVQGKVKGSG